MGLKKLTYILVIFIISILHTVALTTWLDNDSSVKVHTEAIGLENNTDSIQTAKASALINSPEIVTYNQ